MAQASDDHTTGGTGYLLVGALASGGMAEVSLVMRREGDFERIYALKRLLAPLQADEQVRAMFLDEARFAGLIRHSNVVSVVDVGEDAQGPYLVMDYVDGVGVDELLRAHAQSGTILPVQVAARLAAQIARGLHAAHELTKDGERLGLVHRDVSPQNILLGFDGVARVTDFGIAKAASQTSRTATGIIKGKLGYLAPEQLRFEEPDRRSDLFALGVVLFELLAGRRLYKNTDGMDGVRRILGEPPPDIQDDRPDVPPELVALLFRLLAKDRAQRPASALEVARVLEDVVAELAALEGPVDLADYLQHHFGERRRQRQAMIDEGIARLTAGEPSSRDEAATPPSEDFTAMSPPSVRGTARPAAIGVLVAALLGGMIGVVAWPKASAATLEPMDHAPVELVTLSFASEPPGAVVAVDGRARGRTPLEVVFPRSDHTASATFELEGYAPTSEPLLLSTSQRIRVTLRPAASTSASIPAPPVQPARPPRASPAPPVRPAPPPKPTPRIRRIGEQ